LEVEETIADAASNGNTLEAMAAAVLVAVGWIRRALEEPVTEVNVDDLAVEVRVMGSLPRRTWPGGFFVESSALDFVLPGVGRLASSQGQIVSAVEGTVGVLFWAAKAGSSEPSGGESLKSPWPVAPYIP
jgi:hypothetical protein